MKKGNAFKVVISIVLGLAVLWTALLSFAFVYWYRTEADHRANERQDVFVAGVPVLRENMYDVLGDGTVMYDNVSHKLTFCNAVIECEGPIVYSQRDLTMVFVGENKFLCTGDDAVAVYASDGMLRKDLSFEGDGSLVIEVQGRMSTCGIVADDLWIASDLSVSLSGGESSSVGLECSFLNIEKEKQVTVKVEPAEEAMGIYVRGDMTLQENCVLNVDGSILSTGTIIAEENAAIQGNAPLRCNVFYDDGAAVAPEIDAVSGIHTMN